MSAKPKSYIEIPDGPMQSMYLTGKKSMTEIADYFAVSYSTVRRRLQNMGIVRSKKESCAIAGPKIGAANTGNGRVFSRDELARAASLYKTRRNVQNPKGIRINPKGYLEYTCGEHFGQLEHRVVMAAALGRPLATDEVVHHRDHNKTNNALENLQLMTPSAHAAHHRAHEKALKGKK